jgi:hypothetical protein
LPEQETPGLMAVRAEHAKDEPLKWLSISASLRVLVNASARLVSIGSRLTTPIIIINMRDIKRRFGIPDVDDGA